MQPFIIENFNGAIWRMEIDELTETIFVEVRDSEEKRVSFGSVNLISGEIYFKDLTTPERWLTGIEAAYDGVLLLHNYQTESGPAHKGLVAIDGQTAATLWSNYNVTFDHLSVQGPILFDSRFQPRKLFLIDVKTGATIGNYPSSDNKELPNSIVLPELVSYEIVNNMSQIPAFGGAVHYLEHNNFRIVSLHSLIEGWLSQHLFVMDGDEKVYEDLLNNNIQKMQPEAFILHKERLIYIKNKSELKVLTL
ncbi:MAG TPA: DUF4905 domain-containing protein [Mucilaginibacter sp.]|jgi:hypothetical protein